MSVAQCTVEPTGLLCDVLLLCLVLWIMREIKSEITTRFGIANPGSATAIARREMHGIALRGLTLHVVTRHYDTRNTQRFSKNVVVSGPP